MLQLLEQWLLVMFDCTPTNQQCLADLEALGAIDTEPSSLPAPHYEVVPHLHSQFQFD